MCALCSARPDRNPEKVLTREEHAEAQFLPIDPDPRPAPHLEASRPHSPSLHPQQSPLETEERMDNSALVDGDYRTP